MQNPALSLFFSWLNSFLRNWLAPKTKCNNETQWVLYHPLSARLFCNFEYHLRKCYDFRWDFEAFGQHRPLSRFVEHRYYYDSEDQDLRNVNFWRIKKNTHVGMFTTDNHLFFNGYRPLSESAADTIYFLTDSSS